MISTAKLAIAAGIVLALAADVASAAPARVKTNTNLRQGPGTNFGVTATVPGGSIVDIRNCAGEWCTASWRGRIGYMIATNLDPAGPGPGPGPGPVVAGGPPVVVYADPGPIAYGPPYYYGPRYYWGPRYRYWRRW